MNEEIFDNLWEMFATIKIDNKDGYEVFSADDPKRLLIGWVNSKSEKCYYIRTMYLRSRRPLIMKANYDEIAYNELSKLIVSSSGRTMLANYLGGKEKINSIDSYIKRLISLKAFW